MSISKLLINPLADGAQSEMSSKRVDDHHPMSAALLQAAAEASAQETSDSPPGAEDLDHDDDRHSDVEGEHEPGHDLGAEGDGTEANAKRKKRSRACQACRGMKIRCLPVEGQEACKACSKVNRACIMPGPARKRQKTVHKVAELEKKIEALTKSLATKNSVIQEGGDPAQQNEIRHNSIATVPVNSFGHRTGFGAAPTPPSESPGNASTPSMQTRYTANQPQRQRDHGSNWDIMREKAFPETTEFATDATSSDDYVDAITRGVLSLQRAKEVFERWKSEMCPHCPFVAFSDDVTVEWLRRKKPMTLLAILGVACGTIQPEIQADLMVELTRQLAERVMYLCEKSLDIAQALLISPMWYGKHKYAKDLGFNQYIHSAVTMCLDLGLGKRSRNVSQVSVEEDLEKRRLWLGAYFMAGNVTTVLRLPSLVKFSTYIQESLDVLDSHPSRLPTDPWLCAQARLMHLMEDISILFSMDDPCSSIPLNDSKTQYLLKKFSRQLKEWEDSSKNLLYPVVLEQYLAVTALYIHEIAMHVEHNVDDFTPDSIYKLNPAAPFAQQDFMTNEHFEAVSICVDSMEAAFVAFENIDLRILRSLPCIHMVWIAYVGVSMIRLHNLLKAPDSKYGEIFLTKMHVEQHLDSCVARLQFIVSETSHSPAEAFLTAFKKLRAWFALRNSEGLNGANAAAANAAHAAILQKGNEAACIELPRSPMSNPNSTNAPLRYSGSLHNQAHSQPQSPQGQALQGYASLNQPPHTRQGEHVAQQGYMSNQPRMSNLLNQPTDSNIHNGNSNGNSTSASTSFLDPNVPIDASTFDLAWDLNGINTNLSELNNFDVYMNDVGWMGYLI